MLASLSGSRCFSKVSPDLCLTQPFIPCSFGNIWNTEKLEQRYSCEEYGSHLQLIVSPRIRDVECGQLPWEHLCM